MELIIARNPDPDSSLPYLLRLPLGTGLVFRVRDVWPRTAAVYCHPVSAQEWPQDPEIVVRESMRACERRGAAIDVVLERARENRSQIVFTRARGRDVVFWQSSRTRKQARPHVAPPKGAAPGAADLTVLIDTRERYAYRFTDKPVQVSKRALPVGDYGVEVAGQLIAVVERKSLDDFITSLRSGKMRFAMSDLAAVPRAAVVVEDRFSGILKQPGLRPAAAADGVAELQVRWPNVPILFLETRPLAEEYTYRFLAAAAAHLADDSVVEARVADLVAPESTAEIREWANVAGLAVSDRGRLPHTVVEAYRRAHPV